jgi:hypothetical protein
VPALLPLLPVTLRKRTISHSVLFPLISDDNEIISGHGRAEAVKLLGMESVPSLRLSKLSAAQQRPTLSPTARLERETNAPTLFSPIRQGDELRLTWLNKAEVGKMPPDGLLLENQKRRCAQQQKRRLVRAYPSLHRPHVRARLCPHDVASVVPARWATIQCREHAEFLPRFPAVPIPC